MDVAKKSLTRTSAATRRLAMSCKGYLRTAEQQKALAKEMTETARNMHDHAVDMRKPPRLVLP